MAQPARSGGHPLFDLACVVVLGALLWLGAQAIGAVTRDSTLHPASTGHATAADCGPGGTRPAEGALASLAVTGGCADTKPAAAH